MPESLESRFQNLHEFVTQARTKLDRNNWDYLIGGSETDTTLARNRLALDAIGFRPRVLRDVSNIDCSLSLFGKKLRIPVLLRAGRLAAGIRPGRGCDRRRGDAHRRQRHDPVFGVRGGWTRRPRPRATASKSSSSMCAATPNGSTTMSAAQSTRAMTPFA